MVLPQVGVGLGFSSAKSRVRFFRALALVTALPLLCLGFGMKLFPGFASFAAPALAPIIFATGTEHVGATAFFYCDVDLKPVLEGNLSAFLLWPVLVIVACLVSFCAGVRVWTLVLAGFLAWQLYHYQRQNYGLIAFAARAADVVKLPAELPWMLNLGVAGAIAGLLRPWSIAFEVSVLLFVASSVLLVKVLAAMASEKKSGFVVLFTLLSWAFFVPVLLWPGQEAVRNGGLSTLSLGGFWSYAIAHGAQYFIFMGVLAGNTKQSGKNLLKLSLVTTVAAYCLQLFARGGPIQVGLTTAHFIIDRKAWRLREPLQRKIVGRRFAFILEH
jgi:hypothetical protein